MKKKLLAVDGNSILNRAFYGVRPLSTKDGFPTNALYGMVTMIHRQVEQLQPDACAVAFDLKAPTFRHRIYGEYKAGRRPMPEELALQLPVAKELLEAMGFAVLSLEGYEADDILGTLASLCEAEDWDAYLMTGDRDALQLIAPSVHVLLATNAETIDMDEAKFFEKYGVRSSQFVDVKALMGDSSDHIPGVPGIGEKTALRLIADYGSLDGVYEALPTAKHTPSVRSRLETGRESAYLSQTLARICREVPLELRLELLSGKPDVRALRALFLRLEFSAFLKRFVPEELPDVTEVAGGTEPTDATLQELEGFLAPRSSVAVDMEEDRLLFSDGETILSVRTLPESVVSMLSSKTLLVYDSKRFYRDPRTAWLRGLAPEDLLLMGYLANSSKNNYTPQALCADWLGELLPERAYPVQYFHRLAELLLCRLEESGQLSLYRTLELPLAEVLADMESAGFYIDREGIADYGEQLSAVAAQLEDRIYFAAGREFNIHSPKQLGEVLFEDLGLPHAKKTKTGYSTNAEILEKLRSAHPIVADILDYRQVTKLKSTYVDGLLRVADEKGRVHTNFKQTGTATGRLSSTEPNLQNIPIRTELGRELRRFFLPKDPDWVIIDADYSQIELRLLAHVSKDESMCRAFQNGEDVHTSTASTVFGVPAEAVTPEMRKRAKAVNFGIMYGIGAFSLSDDIGVSRAEAQAYIDQYLAGYPEIDRYLRSTIAAAYEDGYVSTLFGRRRYIPELAGKNKMQQKFGERVAMNSPIQGTAADVIKLAMIRVHRRLRSEGLEARLILQVHDELLVEASRKDAEAALAILREEMEGAVQYSVPLEVDIHVGRTWFDAK